MYPSIDSNNSRYNSPFYLTPETGLPSKAFWSIDLQEEEGLFGKGGRWESKAFWKDGSFERVRHDWEEIKKVE